MVAYSCVLSRVSGLQQFGLKELSGIFSRCGRRAGAPSLGRAERLPGQGGDGSIVSNQLSTKQEEEAEMESTLRF